MFVIASEEGGWGRKSRGSDSRCLPLQSELALVAVKAPHQGKDAGKEEVTETQAPQPQKKFVAFLFLSGSRSGGTWMVAPESPRNTGCGETEPRDLYLVLVLWSQMGGASGI